MRLPISSLPERSEHAPSQPGGSRCPPRCSSPSRARGVSWRAPRPAPLRARQRSAQSPAPAGAQPGAERRAAAIQRRLHLLSAEPPWVGFVWVPPPATYFHLTSHQALTPTSAPPRGRESLSLSRRAARPGGRVLAPFGEQPSPPLSSGIGTTSCGSVCPAAGTRSYRRCALGVALAMPIPPAQGGGTEPSRVLSPSCLLYVREVYRGLQEQTKFQTV